MTAHTSTKDIKTRIVEWQHTSPLCTVCDLSSKETVVNIDYTGDSYEFKPHAIYHPKIVTKIGNQNPSDRLSDGTL